MIPLLALLFLQSVQPPTRWPIESLSVEGGSRYSAAEILAVAGLKIGQVAGKQELEAARQRVMATGYFGGVGYRYKPSAAGKGIVATLEVVEIEDVYPVRFERLETPPTELEELLRRSDPLFREKIPAAPPVLDRYAKAIRAFLAARNVKIEVVGKLGLDSANQWAIVFTSAAPLPAIAEVRFVGSSVIPADALQAGIAAVAIGAPYTEADFRVLLESSIRPLYEARGRLRVAFPELHVQPAQQAEGVVVTVTVDEGAVYALGEVHIAAEGFPEAELRKVAALSDFPEIDAAQERIKQRLHRSGYLKPDTRVERTLHDDTRKVDIVVRVDHGPQYQFGKLVIEGLDLIAEAEVRRLWSLKPGTPFDSGYPDYFLSRMQEDGVFDNLGKTKSATQIDDASKTVDVTLTFRPAPKPPPRKPPTRFP